MWTLGISDVNDAGGETFGTTDVFVDVEVDFVAVDVPFLDEVG